MSKRLLDHDALIEEIYGAVTAPETWPAVINSIARAVGAQSGVLALTDSTKRDADLMFTTGVITDSRLQSLYAETYRHLDPAIPYFSALAPGEVAVTSRIWGEREQESFVFYQDYFTKECGLFDFLAINLVRDDGRSAIVGVQRALGCEAFDDANVLLIKKLAPHLQRAFELHRAFVGLAGARDALADIVDKIPTAAFIVGPDEQVRFANRAAECLIRENNGLTVDRNRRLRLIDSAAASQLSALIRAAISAKDSAGAKISIQRHSGRLPLSVSISRAPTAGCEQLALLLVEEPVSDNGGMRLMSFYGLTNRELELLNALVAGIALKDHCEAVGISINTGRFHLKKLFAKTGARSQADLIRIALPVLRRF